jgi:hypothetical protein
MSTDLDRAPTNPTGVDVLAYLGLDPRDIKAQALVTICQRYALDPIAGHVVLVDRKPYITRDGLLHVAHRSGQLDGIELVSGPELIEGEWRCVVAVYRKDMSRPFTFPGRYPAKGHRYAPEMALKTAESMALRRAFDVTGLASIDEVHDAPAASAEVEDDPDPDRPGHAIARPRYRTTPGGQPYINPPTDKQLTAWNARLRAAGCRDETHRGWATATLLDAPAYIASLRDLTREQLSALLQLGPDDLADALAVTADLPHPDDEDTPA